MLIKPIVAAAAFALAATLAPPAHATDLPLCTATAPGGHTRAYCTFYAPPGTYKVTMSSTRIRYAWAQVDCPLDAPLHAGAWDTDGGYAESRRFLYGGQCVLTVAAGANTSTAPGYATGTVYLVI